MGSVEPQIFFKKSLSQIVKEFGMDMYMLLYLKWITNKDLLYSTGNSAQMVYGSLDEKDVWGRMDTCMAESLNC